MSKKDPKNDVIKIHMNQEQYSSPNPTSGAALYVLGNIDPSKDLYREGGGHDEDTIIPNDDTEIHLEHGEHFYSEQVFTIIVNGQEKTVTKKLLTYEEIVVLAFEAQPNFEYTITYRKGPNSNKEGSLEPGEVVKIKNRMIFNVTATNKS